MKEQLNKSASDLYLARAKALRLDAGDLFEVLRVEESEDGVTIAIKTSKHGRVLAEAWSLKVDRAPDPYDIVLLNELGRATGETMLALYQAAKRVAMQERVGDGYPGLVSTFIEPFVLAALSMYVIEMSPIRHESVPSEIRPAASGVEKIAIEVGAVYGKMSANATLGGKDLGDFVARTNNGAIMSARMDSYEDDAAIDRDMEICKGIASTPTPGGKKTVGEC